MLPKVAPAPLRFPCGLPPPSVVLTETGGAATLSVSVGRDALLPLLALTELGGGATTSAGPKIRPIRLLTSDPLADGEGGGGTTALLGSAAMLPLVRCMSAVMSVEGGGATVAGAGKVNFELRTPARSGAETGGGTTPGSMVCTGADENW